MGEKPWLLVQIQGDSDAMTMRKGIDSKSHLRCTSLFRSRNRDESDTRGETHTVRKEREVMKRVTQTAESGHETQHDDEERNGNAEGAGMKENGKTTTSTRTGDTRQRAR